MVGQHAWAGMLRKCSPRVSNESAHLPNTRARVHFRAIRVHFRAISSERVAALVLRLAVFRLRARSVDRSVAFCLGRNAPCERGAVDVARLSCDQASNLRACTRTYARGICELFEVT